MSESVKTPPEFHQHIASLDSASSLQKHAEREMELETGYLTTTDHGTLGVTRDLYDICAPGGKFHGKLKPIIGLEAYMRDDSCPILLKGGYKQTVDRDGRISLKEAFKYAHITMHCCDEKAYFKLVKKLSDADLTAEQHGSERKPIFNWTDLEELGSENMTFGSGCLIGVVGRHLMQNNDVKSAIAYYERVRSLVRPGNFYAELFPHTTDTYWQSAVFFKLEDGTEVFYPGKKKVKTNYGEMYAEDLAADFKKGDRARQKHGSVLDVMENRKWSGKQHLNLVSVELREGFVKNECTPWCNHSDYQQEINKFVFALAKKYGDKIVCSTDSHFAYPVEWPIQDIRLNNWRFGQSHHRMSGKESFDHFSEKLGVTHAMFSEWTENGFEWAAKFNDFKFTPRKTLPVDFYPKDTLRHTFDLIKTHGRMDWNDPRMTSRLKEEIDLLHKNGTIDLFPYFFVCEDVTNHYTKHGEIMGPARGSAGGVLLSYLLGITQMNPLKYGLSLYRFLSPDRIASGGMPDIDNDFPHRDLLLGKNGEGGFLKERFGDHVARLSTDIALKLKSAMKDVHRFKDGFVSKEINEICKKLPDAPQGVSPRDFIFGYEIDGTEFPGIIDTDETLQNYVAAYPKHWDLVVGLLSLVRGKSTHACGFVVANYPIDTFIPAITVADERVTGFTAKAVEASGGLKVDFLVVNSIRDIGFALRLIQNKHGGADWKALRGKTDSLQLLKTETGMTPYGMCLPFKGSMLDIWNLPDDKRVFMDICSGKVETVFQLDAAEARRGLKEFPVIDGEPTLKSVKDLAVFTALDRPGPLDAYVEDENGNKHNMLVEFARRARGEKPTGAIPALDDMLRDTLGVLVFQESLQAVFQEVGGTTGIEANNFRARIGKKKINEVRKKDEPLFMKGAIPKLGEVEAQRLWGQMITFGQYGFCIDGEQRVYTDQGLMKMKDVVNNPDLKVKVLSYNQATGLTEYVAPSARLNMGHKKVFTVEFENGSSIKATEDHKFLHLGEWISLSDLSFNLSGFGTLEFLEDPQQEVFPSDKRLTEIEEVLLLGVRAVYDIEVPGNHNFILEGGFIAHNCQAHATAYMIVAYACAFLKHYYPLEWWTAVLSNADKDDINGKFWRHCKQLLLLPDVTKSSSNFEIEGDSIRAPVWLINGIGEKAYTLLSELTQEPLKSLTDLLTRIEVWRKEKSTFVTKTDKYGQSVQAVRLATCPLNDTILRKLIVCGVMDGLFPERDDKLPLDTSDKLTHFDITAARVRGKKIKPSATKFNLTLDLTRYQYIKSIMPAFSEPLIPMFKRFLPEKFKDHSSDVLYYVANDGEKYGLLTGDQFEWLESLETLPETAMSIALPAYVVSQEIFNYEKHGRSNTACKMFLDIEGCRREFVRWPGKEGIPRELKGDMKGALVVALMSRRKPTDNFFFQTVEVVLPPMQPEPEESSPPSLQGSLF